MEDTTSKNAEVGQVEVIRLEKVSVTVQTDLVQLLNVGVQTDITVMNTEQQGFSSDNLLDNTSEKPEPSKSSKRKRRSESFRKREESEEDFKTDGEQRRILFVKGVNCLAEIDFADEVYMYEIFKRYGEIIAIKIIKQKAKKMRLDNGQEHKYDAFITFTETKSVCDAIKYYKEDHPEGEDFRMYFGGRKKSKQSYSDLDLPK